MRKLDVIDLIAKLVAMKTVTGQSNLVIVRWFDRLLKGLGFETIIQRKTYGENSKKEVVCANLVARFGPRDVEPLMLCGHMDTVPPGKWSDWHQENPFRVVFSEGKLFGLGVLDMKGSIATMICAVAPLLSQLFHRELIISLTHGEESGLLGIKLLQESSLVKPKYALIGEPTMMRPIRKHKGPIDAFVHCSGLSAHASDPCKGINAIEIAAEVIDVLRDFREELKAQLDDDFDPPFTTLNIGTIHGGEAINIIPSYCEIGFEIRPIPGQDTLLMFRDLQIRLESIRRDDQGNSLVKLNPTREPVGGSVSTESSSLIVRVAEEVTGQKAGTVPFGTEASIVQLMGADCLILGPGDIHQAHKPDESIELSQLVLAVDQFRKIVQRICIDKAV